MKTYLTLMFIFFCVVSNSQEKKLIWSAKTCENGAEKAKKDFIQGYYFCENFGLIAETDSAFSEFHRKYLEEKYKIISVNGGCVITEYRKCYSETMEKLVFEKFGADIFERSLSEARKIFNKKK